jgi:ribosome-binding protein aMBF1 (putative translation factor)
MDPSTALRRRRCCMSERESWNDVRDRRFDSPAARAGYEHARSAYEIGRVVRELRESRGLSQRELAERMGTTQSVVGRLEAGGSRPTIVTLDRVAYALGLRLEVSFHDPSRSPKPPARQRTHRVLRTASGR